jgi:hypothetical protein
MAAGIDPPILAVVSALGGVVVGGLLEGWRARSAFRREKVWERDRGTREHLEQVYEALEQVRECYGLSAGNVLRILATGQAGTNDQIAKVPWARLRVLVNLYAPELRDSLSELEDVGMQTGSVIARALMQSSANQSQNRMLGDEVLAQNKVLSAKVDTVRDALLDTSKALAVSEAKALGR